MRKYFLLICISILLLVYGCGGVEDVNGVEDGDYENIKESNNDMTFELLHHAPTDENGNKMFSSTSALMALLLAFNGAEGDTKQEIAESLHLEQDELEEINKGNHSLLETLHDKEDVELTIANSLWIHEDYDFQDTYKEEMQTFYEAEIETFLPQEQASINKLNQWVEDKTNEKIKEMFDGPLSEDTRAILLNAIYFKAAWQHPFQKEITEKDSFHGDEIVDVPFMRMEEELLYMENDTFQAVQLPYEDGDMSMEIYLPNENYEVEEILEQFTVENWQDWQSDFQKKAGQVKLPKFQLTYESELNQLLHEIGIDLAFKPEAEFSNMIHSDDPLWIDEVKQKTYIDVNEEGTEAAAATSVQMRTTSAPIDPFTMEVDRPFLFLITDQSTDMILFAGTISKPMYEE